MIFVVIRDQGIGQTPCSFERVSCVFTVVSYYIGDQFIEPYGSSGSLPLFSYYV